MASATTTKTAIKYEDNKGIIRTKNCGNAESVRECVSWLKRKGFKFISKEVVKANRASCKGQTKPR